MATTNHSRVAVAVLAVVLAAAAGLALVGLAAKPAQADDTVCTGVVTGVHDNVVVPDGAVCILTGAQVKGNVLVKTEGTLMSRASTIVGNVQGPQVRQILLQFQTQVGGDVHIKGANPGTLNGFDINVRVGGDAQLEENQGRVFVDAAFVEGDLEVRKNITQGLLEVEFNTVGGNIKVEDNVIQSPSSMSVLGNRVTGNLQVFKNTGTGPKQVVSNTVRENLQCFENDPLFIGGPNAAQKREGQCF
jgi:hypothetical protein